MAILSFHFFLQSSEDLAIPVFYAREYITEDMKKTYKEKDFRTAAEEADFWMRAKANAMEETLRQQYDANDMSWSQVSSQILMRKQSSKRKQSHLVVFFMIVLFQIFLLYTY